MAEINNSGAGQWSETDAGNTSPPPDGAPAGTYPNQAEGIWRAMMGALKRSWDRINGTVTTAGSAGAYAYVPADVAFPTALVTGEIYTWRANFTSVGNDTLNVNALGARALYKASASGPARIAAGDIQAGQMVQSAYDAALNSAAGGFHVLSGISPVAAPTFPSGTILDFAGTAVPAGYLECNGQAISRTAYAALFAAIGTVWGAGDGTTTFNVPNLNGLVTAGRNAPVSLPTTVGSTAGEYSHILTQAEMPVHNHSAASNSSASTSVSITPGGVQGILGGSGGPTGFGGADAQAIGVSASASTSVTTTTTIGNAGSGGSHNNVQPTAVVMKIIKV